MQFMRDFQTRVEENGEFVDVQVLMPDGAFVRYDGEGRPPVTDGPFAETKDLIAGWYIIDVESWDRAVQLAGELSAAPGPGGKPLQAMAGGSAISDRIPDRHRVNEPLLRDLVPAVIGVLVRRGADFALAEDAVQDALVEAVRGWPDDPPHDPRAGWSLWPGASWDATRADTSRRRRELRVEDESMPGPVEAVDDTLQLYFLCAHPSPRRPRPSPSRFARSAA